MGTLLRGGSGGFLRFVEDEAVFELCAFICEVLFRNVGLRNHGEDILCGFSAAWWTGCGGWSFVVLMGRRFGTALRERWGGLKRGIPLSGNFLPVISV